MATQHNGEVHQVGIGAFVASKRAYWRYLKAQITDRLG